MDLNLELKEIIDRSSRIVFFGGAGVSTESNIPDFRSSDGLYKQKRYPYPAEVMLSSDFFYEVNQRLHEKLLYYRIPHDYIIRPGSHTFSYWKNAIEYQLLYFNKYFKSL